MPEATKKDSSEKSLDSSNNYILLRQHIVDSYDTLSPVLRQIADYVLENPDEVALDTIAVTSGKINVPPSALIRFANYYGYKGFSKMQKIFKERLLYESPSYQERLMVSHISESAKQKNYRTHPILAGFIDGTVSSLQSLESTISESDFNHALNLMHKADTVWIAGVRRSYPVASYLNYVLSQLGKKNIFIDGAGNMLDLQSKHIGRNDVLFAISYRRWAPMVCDLVKEKAEKGIPIIALTDSPISPIYRHASAPLLVKNVEVHNFRQISSSMCVILSLAVALGEKMIND